VLDLPAPATGLLDALGAVGLSYPDLVQRSTALVLFGSRAAGCAREGSDWDLLAIGEGPCPVARHLDLVWIHPRDLDSGTFLATELAGHVARYGRWLHGPFDWRSAVACGPAAAERKARRLASRLCALERAWPLLTPGLRCEERTLFRRDLQRFDLLARSEAVPPSRMLDEAWETLPDPQDDLLRMANAAGLSAGLLTRVLIPPQEAEAPVDQAEFSGLSSTPRREVRWG